VEDVNIVASDLKQRLEKLGYKIVDIVDNGKDAIKVTEETKPDIILMDIILKGDLDGIETIQIINELHDIPHIYLTAYYDDKILERASKTQPYGYITKPFEDIGLYTAIQLALYKHQKLQRLENSSKIIKYIKTISKKIIKLQARN